MAFQSHRYHYNSLGAWTAPASRSARYAAAAVNSAALANVLAAIARANPAPAAKPAKSAANRTRQAVMREAWAIKREEPSATFANCLRTAWAIILNLGA